MGGARRRPGTGSERKDAMTSPPAGPPRGNWQQTGLQPPTQPGPEPGPLTHGVGPALPAGAAAAPPGTGRCPGSGSRRGGPRLPPTSPRRGRCGPLATPADAEKGPVPPSNQSADSAAGPVLPRSSCCHFWQLIAGTNNKIIIILCQRKNGHFVALITNRAAPCRQ